MISSLATRVTALFAVAALALAACGTPTQGEIAALPLGPMTVAHEPSDGAPEGSSEVPPVDTAPDDAAADLGSPADSGASGGAGGTSSSGSTDVVDVRQYGAKCDGSTNDTRAFAAASAALTKADGGTLWLPPGATCVVGKQTFEAGSGYTAEPIIAIRDCTKPVAIAGNGATLVASDGLRFGSFDPNTGKAYTPTSLPFENGDYRANAYSMVYVENSASVVVTDLELDGNIDGLKLGGQWGDTGRQADANGILAVDNQSLTIRDVYTHHHGLDGVQIAHYGLTPSSDATPVLLEGVRSEYNARQGLSWVGGIDLTARDSTFSHTGRARFASAPAAGVDIEAEDSVIRDGVFEDCEFVNNVGPGMVADSGDSADITVRDSSFWGISNYALWAMKPGMRFESCDFHGTVIHAFGSREDPTSAAQFIDSSFDDRAHPTYGRPYIYEALVDLEGEGSPNVTFDGCVFTATTAASMVVLAEDLDDPVVVRNSTFDHRVADTSPARFEGVLLRNVRFTEHLAAGTTAAAAIEPLLVRVGPQVVVDGPLVTFDSQTGTIAQGVYTAP